jgi:hypothetical protein
MTRSFLSSRARRWVALLLLSAMPLQFAGAATFRANGACSGHGQALVTLVTVLLGQPCAGDDVPPVKDAGLVTRASDCAPPPTFTAAPCSDCGLHCGALAWVIVARATPDLVASARFLAIPSPLAILPAPDPDRLERPPRIAS